MSQESTSEDGEKKNYMTKIKISNSTVLADVLISGWSNPEDNGVWTDGIESMLRIKVPVPFGRHRLFLRLAPYCNPKYLPKQKLRVTVSNEIVFEEELSFEQNIECDISELSTMDKSHILVHLYHPDATSPREIYESSDLRILGFKLISAELRSLDQSASSVGEECEVGVSADNGSEFIAPENAFLSDDPPKFLGEAKLKFTYSNYLSLFGLGTRHETIQIFNPLMPPSQIKLYINEHKDQTIRNKRVVFRDHLRYPPPPGVSAYSIKGATLWDKGVVTYGKQFVLLWDCVPRYVRNYLNETGHNIPLGILDPCKWKERIVIKSEYPVASPLHPNYIYGHFLLEMLPRFYVLSLLLDMGVHLKVAFAQGQSKWIDEFVKLFFNEGDIIRFDEDKEIIDSPSVIIPSMMHNEHNFHPAFNLMISDIHRRVQCYAGTHNLSTKVFSQKIFLSRSKFYRNNRLQNETDVENLMRLLNIEIIHPQELSVIEQISLFKNARLIVGDYSSAIHGVMFCDPGARVVCIDYHSSFQSGIARIRQLPHCFVTPSDGQFKHWSLFNDEERNYNVDISVLRETIISFYSDEDLNKYTGRVM